MGPTVDAIREVMEQWRIRIEGKLEKVKKGINNGETNGLQKLEEDLSILEVIDELGPSGRYIDHEHTLRHYKEPYYSQLADKNPYSVWLKRGGTSMEQRAGEMVDKILTRHQPLPLPDDIQAEIKKIVTRQQAGISSKG